MTGNFSDGDVGEAGAVGTGHDDLIALLGNYIEDMSVKIVVIIEDPILDIPGYPTQELGLQKPPLGSSNALQAASVGTVETKVCERISFGSSVFSSRQNCDGYDTKVILTHDFRLVVARDPWSS